jgi:hypothetical protein
MTGRWRPALSLTDGAGTAFPEVGPGMEGQLVTSNVQYHLYVDVELYARPIPA